MKHLRIVKKKHFDVVSLHPIGDLQCQIFADFMNEKETETKNQLVVKPNRLDAISFV
jgi:hypothetical protein